MDGIITGTITPGQGGLGSNGNERVFYTSKSSRTEASPADAV